MKHARLDYDRIQDPAGLIPEDEPVILFRAQDKHFCAILRHYLVLLARDRTDDDATISTAVYWQLQRGRVWQQEHGCKSPDIPAHAIAGDTLPGLAHDEKEEAR